MTTTVHDIFMTADFPDCRVTVGIAAVLERL